MDATEKQEIFSKIQNKIRLLKEEFEEILFLRCAAEQLRNIRKKLVKEMCD